MLPRLFPVRSTSSHIFSSRSLTLPRTNANPILTLTHTQTQNVTPTVILTLTQALMGTLAICWTMTLTGSPPHSSPPGEMTIWAGHRTLRFLCLVFFVPPAFIPSLVVAFFLMASFPTASAAASLPTASVHGISLGFLSWAGISLGFLSWAGALHPHAWRMPYSCLEYHTEAWSYSLYKFAPKSTRFSQCVWNVNTVILESAS